MIGKAPLDQLVKDHGIEVEWKSYELRPMGVEMPPKSPEYMERARAGVAALSEQYGIEMKWNAQSKHSRFALEGAKFAEAYGKGGDYQEALFAAQFQQNQNINDIEILVLIAEKIGLPSEPFREALEKRLFKEQVDEEIQEAQDIGITGIPCFIAGNTGVMGVQSYESLVALLEQASE